MRRKIVLSITLVLIMSIAFLSVSDSSQAQGQLTKAADTGLDSLGPNQVLRVSIGPQISGELFTIQFRQIGYVQGVCNGGVCRQTIASQSISAPITLLSNQAVFFDIPFDPKISFVRGVVEASRPNVRVVASIVNIATGEVDALFDASNCGLALIDPRDCG